MFEVNEYFLVRGKLRENLPVLNPIEKAINERYPLIAVHLGMSGRGWFNDKVGSGYRQIYCCDNIKKWLEAYYNYGRYCSFRFITVVTVNDGNIRLEMRTPLKSKRRFFFK